MKLYKINCYGANYGIGLNAEEAIDFYLYRNPELEVIEDIRGKLEAILVLTESELEQCFDSLPNMSVGASDEAVMKFMNSHDFKYASRLSGADKLGVWELFNLIRNGVSIYGEVDNMLQLVLSGMTPEEYNNFKLRKAFTESLPNKYDLLLALGFNQQYPNVYRIDDEGNRRYFVYIDGPFAISEYNYTDDMLDVQFVRWMSIGQFVEEFVEGKNFEE